MEAQPPHSIASIILQPTSFAFPPDGAVKVAPQTEQEIIVVALEKITDSDPQSLQVTLIKFPATQSPHLSTNSNFLAL
tara:strand:- start:315 stop:548 length:234 start_codon:yes stop_codon:yes gene_type:complete